MGYLDKAIKVTRRDGLCTTITSGIPFLYNRHIAPQLPRRSATYNGVEVKAARYFDGILPWRRCDRPKYESGIVAALEGNIREDDNVVIVGGGWGVTTVKVAQLASDGTVTVYEGSTEHISHIEDTLSRNNLSGDISIRHSVVGIPTQLWGNKGKAGRTNPSELAECDVLELDCEGSEKQILRNMGIRPRCIIVETHGMYDSSTSEVQQILEELSYDIESVRIAEEEFREHCIENDVYVIVATKM